MNNSLNSMTCSNNDHVDRLDFLENEKEETFMFDPINLTRKEPLPNDEPIMDAYVYNKFCKSQSCFALGQANDLK
jgi:hypothetical protein